MKVEWVVAKYMEDLRRRETRNVGVILRVGDLVLSRFVAQREDGEIDGRRARAFKSVDTYKAWVAYWQYRMERAPEQGLLAALEFQEPSNFIIEYGGERLWSSEMPEPFEFLEELYGMLVDDKAASASVSPRDRSEAIIRELPIADRIERDYGLERPGPDRLMFDFRYLNGADHLMKVVGLTRAGKPGWDAAHAAAWAFMQAQDVLGSVANPIALVATSKRDSEVELQLEMLGARAEIVDISNARAAKRRLSELLHLAS